MAIKRTFSRAQALLSRKGLPYSDDIALSESKSTFSSGGDYGVEIPVVNNYRTLVTLTSLLQKNGIYCSRFNETHGSFLLSDSEIKDMLSTCRELNYGMVFSLGPRPEYDVKSSFYRCKFGLEQGRQLNNCDAIAASVDEAYRLVDLGCRGIIVYDIGVLKILADLKKAGDLPQDLMFKASSHCMVSNPMIAKIYDDIGASSVTLTHDVGLPVIQEMRRLAPNLVLDIPIDVYPNKGGFIRYYDMAELVQIGSPLFFKMGASVQTDPYDSITDETLKKRANRVLVGLEYLQKIVEKTRVNPGEKQVCLPVDVKIHDLV